MSKLDRIPPRIPIGYGEVTINGATQRVSIYPDRDWYRFWSVQLVERVGGIDFPTLPEVADEFGLEPVGQPQEMPEDLSPPVVQISEETPNYRLEALEAQVALLMALVNDMQQGQL